MTNTIAILATVVTQLVTNNTAGNNQQGCWTCKGIREQGWLVNHPNCPMAHIEWRDATRKWEDTIIVERTTVTFDLDGTRREMHWDVEKSHTRREWTLKESWDGPQEIKVEPPVIGVMPSWTTNLAIMYPRSTGIAPALLWTNNITNWSPMVLERMRREEK